MLKLTLEAQVFLHCCNHLACRCDIVSALLDYGADTSAYAAGNHCSGGARWKHLIVSTCSDKEENYLQVPYFFRD
jgi:hypothetical protein